MITISRERVITERQLAKEENRPLVYPKTGTRAGGTDCRVCGRAMNPDEAVIELSFSFCDEYDCEMVICFNCIRRWHEMED